MRDFTDSLEKIMLGSPRGILLSPADRERTAYHESGHALVGMLTPGADPVRKVSIIPRGMALGVTLSTPDADRVSYSREELRGEDPASRSAAASPRRSSTARSPPARSPTSSSSPQIARQMVGRWGMSDAIGPDRGAPAATGRARCCRARARPPSTPSSSIDEEVQRLVDSAHAGGHASCSPSTATSSSRSRRRCSQAETLDAPEAYAAAGVPLPPRVEDEPAAEPAPA